MFVDTKSEVEVVGINNKIVDYWQDLSGAIAGKYGEELGEDKDWKYVQDQITSVKWEEPEGEEKLISGRGSGDSEWRADFDFSYDEDHKLGIYRAKFRVANSGLSVDTFMSVKDGQVVMANMTSNIHEMPNDMGFKEWSYKDEKFFPELKSVKITEKTFALR